MEAAARLPVERTSRLRPVCPSTEDAKLEEGFKRAVQGAMGSYGLTVRNPCVGWEHRP